MEQDDMDLDTLARMVADGFMAIDKRFDALEMRVKNLEIGLKEVNQKIDAGLKAINQRLDMVVELLDDHSTRIKKLELAA